jgi:hypothetical protein
MQVELENGFSGIYEGLMKHGIPDGKGKLTEPNGNVWTGKWCEGKRNGAFTFYCKSDGRTYKNFIYSNGELSPKMTTSITK